MTTLPASMTSLAPTLPAPSCPPDGLGGLLALLDGQERALPLRSVQVRASISGPIVRCRVEQVYDNDLKQILEVIHLFPLPPSAAVHAFTLIAGDVEIQGVCKEKEQAQQEYQTAIEAGHRAALLEEQRADVHSIRAANIPPGAQVHVILELTWVLPWQDGRQRFVFPSTIAPRYLPGTPNSHPGPGVLPNTDAVPDASGLQPPVLIGQSALLDLQVRIQGTVSQLEVAQHSARMRFDGGVLVQPTGARLDRDFVLAFTGAQPAASSLQAWTDGTYTLLQLAPPDQDLAQALPRDASFVVDISGSMSGAKMHAAKLAIKTALRGLEAWDRFRLIAFDDRLEPYQGGEFMPMTSRGVLAAEAWVDALHPRGGTEMLPALTLALSPQASAGRLHTVLFITDGQAWNTQELVAAVYHRRREARLFTLGIDTAVNEALMQQLARVGGGSCTLCTPEEDIEERVAELEARFGAPILTQVQAQGSTSACEVFADSPGVIWLKGSPALIQVSATGPSGLLTLSAAPSHVMGLGPAFAQQRIQELQDRKLCFPHEAEGLNPAILALSLEHGILCELSAFVAVDKSARVLGDKRTVVQPSAIPHGWDPSFGAPAQGAPPSTPRSVSAPGGRSPMKKSKARRRSATRAMSPGAMPPSAPSPMARPSPVAIPAPETASAFQAMPVMSVAADVEESMEESAALSPEPMSPAADAVAQPMSLVGLVQSQQIAGDWGDMPRTIAALMVLILLGHTRRKGSRRRVVAKAARWLAGQAGTQAALAVLTAAEAGQAPVPGSLLPWVCGGLEGELLARTIEG